MVPIDGTVHLILLQFSFSNANAVPPAIKRRQRETLNERKERKTHTDGIVVIEPTLNCSLSNSIDDLEAAGYELVDAFCQKRLDPKDPAGRRVYQMVRYMFARKEFVNISEEFRRVRYVIRAELQEEMCDSALWRVRSLLNPLYNRNGEEVEGQYMMSVNLEARRPLLRADGQLVVEWQKDENGRRIGVAPVPIMAEHILRLSKGYLLLTTVTTTTVTMT